MRRGDHVLVTGGAGFIGSHLVEALAVDHWVTVLDDFSKGTELNLSPVKSRIRIVHASVLDREALQTAAMGATAVFHLAALTSVAESVKRPLDFSRVNVTGTNNVLEAAIAAGAERVVLASSAAVYGDTGMEPAREDMAVKSLSPYATTKIAGEALCREYSRQFGLAAVAVRFFNVYGKRQSADDPYASVIPRFTDALVFSGVPTVYGDGEQTRDFISVHDAVRHMIAAATVDDRSVAGHVYNVGTGQRTSVNEVLRLLQEASGSTVAANRLPAREGDIRHSVADVSRATAELGVRAEVALDAGLRDFVTWWREEQA